MKIASASQIRELAIKQVHLPAVFVFNGLTMEPNDEVIWEHILVKIEEMCGTRNNEFYECMTTLVNGGLFFFDTMIQARQFYKIFNDDQVYSSACYAELYDENGQSLDENT